MASASPLGWGRSQLVELERPPRPGHRGATRKQVSATSALHHPLAHLTSLWPIPHSPLISRSHLITPGPSSGIISLSSGQLTFNPSFICQVPSKGL